MPGVIRCSTPCSRVLPTHITGLGLRGTVHGSTLLPHATKSWTVLMCDKHDGIQACSWQSAQMQLTPRPGQCTAATCLSPTQHLSAPAAAVGPLSVRGPLCGQCQHLLPANCEQAHSSWALTPCQIFHARQTMLCFSTLSITSGPSSTQ